MGKFDQLAADVGGVADDVVKRMEMLGVAPRGGRAQPGGGEPSPAAQTSPAPGASDVNEMFACKQKARETKSCKTLIAFTPSEKKVLESVQMHYGYPSIPQMVVGVALALGHQLEKMKKKED